ncbi:MAG: DUF3253 domain-containing protein [Kofleriaceae bacterium]|jgi:hypothetical protein|nr:DUF3253 domain-containing protein [Kofleriaceae bacterium]MBP9168031.1 DUF3253 domain-containing protein [Kofleriaceae bacterium]MBP9856865.1 DUF3253 domain-containing protein [Kofleriaceae bacterium]
MTWRKAWARSWAEVRYCSERCRRERRDDGADLEAAILAALATRAVDATLCPSEVARQVGGEAWRESLEPVRQAARRLVARGLVVITQRGQVVDPDRARGPIRIRRR